MLVFLVHYISLVEPSLPAAGATHALSIGLRRIAHAGTDIFFMASGFLTYAVLIQRRRPLKDYFLRRFERIYPAYAVTLLAYLLLYFAFPHLSNLPASAPAALLYIGENLLLLPGLLEIEPIILVTWSLGYLLAFYLLAPALVLGCRLPALSSPVRVTLLAGLAGLLLWGGYLSGHVRFVMFAAGMLIYEAHAAGRLRVGGALAATAFVAGSAMLVALPETSLPPVLRFVAIFVLFGAVVRAGLGAGGGLQSRLLRWAPLRALGRMSLSYFLAHGLALNCIGMVVFALYDGGPTPVLFWALLPVCFVASVVAAAVLYAWIEERRERIAGLTIPKWARYSGLTREARSPVPVTPGR